MAWHHRMNFGPLRPPSRSPRGCEAGREPSAGSLPKVNATGHPADRPRRSQDPVERRYRSTQAPHALACRAMQTVTAEALSSALGRDSGPYTARASAKGALLNETHSVFRALADGVSVPEIRDACLVGNLLRQTARETRRQIWTAIHWRYFAWAPPAWVLEDYARAANSDASSPEFVPLAYLHYARRDRLVFDFVVEKLWPLHLAGSRGVSRDDVMTFLDERFESQESRWRESVRIKVAGSVLSSLRNFGLFAGRQRKKSQRPVIAPAAALHHCRLLYAEGLRGRSILEAPDWRLFRWSPEDVAGALARLAQTGHVRFERVGRTVVLELPDFAADDL